MTTCHGPMTDKRESRQGAVPCVDEQGCRSFANVLCGRSVSREWVDLTASRTESMFVCQSTSRGRRNIPSQIGIACHGH